MGWLAVTNGELLGLASSRFEVFITVDRNLSFQQNVGLMPIAVIVLHARSNRLTDLKPLIPNLLSAIATASPGAVTRVGNT
jgi:hypothetical protein